MACMRYNTYLLHVASSIQRLWRIFDTRSIGGYGREKMYVDTGRKSENNDSNDKNGEPITKIIKKITQMA